MLTTQNWSKSWIFFGKLYCFVKKKFSINPNQQGQLLLAPEIPYSLRSFLVKELFWSLSILMTASPRPKCLFCGRPNVIIVFCMFVKEPNFQVCDSILLQNWGWFKYGYNIETCHDLRTSGMNRSNRKIFENTAGLSAEGLRQWSVNSGLHLMYE